ncbi:hypothetical protein LCGC14_3002980, partial [marine sediment metagenome]
MPFVPSGEGTARRGVLSVSTAFLILDPSSVRSDIAPYGGLGGSHSRVASPPLAPQPVFLDNVFPVFLGDLLPFRNDLPSSGGRDGFSLVVPVCSLVWLRGLFSLQQPEAKEEPPGEKLHHQSPTLVPSEEKSHATDVEDEAS